MSRVNIKRGHQGRKVFRELRKWAPNRADRRRGARISERVAQHGDFETGEPFVGVFDVFPRVPVRNRQFVQQW